MTGPCCLCFSHRDICAILAYMKRILNYTITDSGKDQTVLSFLRSHGYSRGVIIHLKKTPEGIRKNGVWCYVSEPLEPGDLLTVILDEQESSQGILPVALPFPVIYEDADILVVNKPAGMPIHPSMNNHSNTLANSAMYYFSQKGESFVYRCVNRLDRDTSGLTVLAKNMLAAAVLASPSGMKTIRREYLALVQGKTPMQGRIEAPIARKEDSCIERRVDFEKGDPAITHYSRLRYDGTKDLSLIRLRLETGRTHQIRVHMKYAGFPLIGDFLYHPDFTYIKRQALHSAHLSFVHPVTEKPLQFDAPLPPDMRII